MIRKIWARLVAWGWDYSYELDDRNIDQDREAFSIAIDDDYGVDMDRALRFAILPARGGCVFEIRHCNLKTHKSETITHVIPEGSDVAREVGQIIAMQLLRH